MHGFRPARALIGDIGNDVFVSAASIWEIAIKHALRRGRADDMPVSGQVAVECFAEAGYGRLAVSAAHTAHVEQLPRLHADPFDRLLVAQAFLEPLGLLSRDAAVLAYGGTTIAV
jgi:PIN domain nuclease of toxin-antitoxin system